MPSSLYVTAASWMVSPSLTVASAAQPGLAEKNNRNTIKQRIDRSRLAKIQFVPALLHNRDSRTSSKMPAPRSLPEGWRSLTVDRCLAGLGFGIGNDGLLQHLE